MKRKCRLGALGAALAVAGAIGFSGQALAAQVKGDYISHEGSVITTNVGSGGGGRFTFDRDALPNGSDEFQGTLVSNGGPPPQDLGGDDDIYFAFCLEPNEFLSDPHIYNVVDLEAAPASGVAGAMGNRADDLRKLFGGVYPDFGVDTGNADFYTALQMAVWEIANESLGSPYNLSGGNFRVTLPAAQVVTAQGWLDALAHGEYDALALTNLVALVDTSTGTAQDFVAQVPIPAAAWLFGSALLGTVALGRRKARARV